MDCYHIEARDLGDAWFQAIDLILDKGRIWEITQGSYVGQKRFELDYVTIHIKYPGTRPLLPQIPPGLGIPNPVASNYLDQYLPYLMTDHLEPEESYTYGSRLFGKIGKARFPGGIVKDITSNQIEEIIKKLKHSFGTNQASATVARPEDLILEDPACLRHIDFRVHRAECLKEKESQVLHMFIYFRSWDAFSGLPANLAGLRILQEYIAEEIGVQAGEIVASSKGLHIYDHAINVAQIRTGRTKLK